MPGVMVGGGQPQGNVDVGEADGREERTTERGRVAVWLQHEGP